MGKIQKRELTELDLTKLDQLKESLSADRDVLQNCHNELEDNYADIIDIDKENMSYYEIMDYIFDTTHTIDASTSKYQSSCMAREIDNELSTLEEAFDEDSKASFTDEISSISEKFNHLQVYSSESSELATQYKKLRTRYLKLKA